VYHPAQAVVKALIIKREINAIPVKNTELCKKLDQNLLCSTSSATKKVNNIHSTPSPMKAPNTFLACDVKTNWFIV
jgi:hypothetical protein